MNRRVFRPNLALISLPTKSEKSPAQTPEPQKSESQEPARPVVPVAQADAEPKKKENQNDKLIGLVEYFFTKCI